MKVRIGALAASVGLALVAPGAASAQYTLVASPNAFAGNNVLNAVSAGSAAEAWAVGSLCCSGRHFGLGTLTEHWNGTAWSVVPSPDSIFNDDVLAGVADISPTDAWAVGEFNQTSFRTRHPLLVHWNGSSWSTVAAPSGSTGELLAVSASGSSDVWAVGDDQHGHATTMHFNGTSWSLVTLPQTVQSAALRGIMAFSPTNVWAVGAQAGGATGPASRTLALHWDGSVWSVVPSPSPDPNANTLAAVGGASPGNLWAVGSKGLDETTAGVPPGTRTLAIHWNGSTWSNLSTPSIGDQDVFTGVAATGAASGAAVGSFDNTSGSIPVSRTLAETWNGTSWAIQPTPNVGTTDNLLKGASSVPGASTAWAVGFHLTNGGPYQTLILRAG